MEKFEQINTLNTLDEKDKVIERLKNELENTNCVLSRTESMVDSVILQFRNYNPF